MDIIIKTGAQNMYCCDFVAQVQYYNHICTYCMHVDIKGRRGVQTNINTNKDVCKTINKYKKQQLHNKMSGG